MTALVILAVLNILDAILTLKILDKGGSELNPLLATLMARVGVLPVLVISKVALILVIYAIGYEPLTWGCCVGYAGLCVWNYRQL
jgi:hypothetical protein